MNLEPILSQINVWDFWKYAKISLGVFGLSINFFSSYNEIGVFILKTGSLNLGWRFSSCWTGSIFIFSSEWITILINYTCPYISSYNRRQFTQTITAWYNPAGHALVLRNWSLPGILALCLKLALNRAVPAECDMTTLCNCRGHREESWGQQAVHLTAWNLFLVSITAPYLLWSSVTSRSQPLPLR